MNAVMMRLSTLALLVASGLAHAGSVPREKWIDQFSTAWPTLACSAEDGFFRACFSTSAERCEKVALSSVRVCLEKSKDDIPAQITSRDMSASLGKAVGTCAGANRAVALARERTRNAKCDAALRDLQQKMDAAKPNPGKDSL